MSEKRSLSPTDTHTHTHTDASLPLPLTARERRRTDTPCLLLFLGAWVVLALVALTATGAAPALRPWLREGDPSLLLHGVDYAGFLCGKDASVISLPFRAFPNLFLDNPSSPDNEFVPALFAVCVSQCPTESGALIQDPHGRYGHWSSPYGSESVVRDCVYSTESPQDAVFSAVTLWSDFLESRGLLVVVGFAGAFVCSLLFLLLTRVPLCLRGVVWGSAGCVLCVLSGGGYWLLERARNEEKDGWQSQTEILLLKTLGGALASLAVLWLCVLCLMRQRIALAISLVRESARALTHMPLLTLTPLLQNAVCVLLTVLWMYVSLYLATSGEIHTVTDTLTGVSYKTISFDVQCQRALVLVCAVWLWSVGCVEALGQIASAHAVLSWYFKRQRGRQITSVQVLRSIAVTVYYHTGTAAFGSLLIAIFRALRLCLVYVKYHLVPRRARSCVVDFVCALYGLPFLSASRRAYSRLFRHLGRVAALSVVGDFVVLVGKLCITLLCAAAVYASLSLRMFAERVDALRGGVAETPRLHGVVMPTVLGALLAFLTATMCLNVLSATADALLQAVIAEEEEDKEREKEKEDKHTERRPQRDGEREEELGLAQQHSERDGERESEREREGDEHAELRALVVRHASQWRDLAAPSDADAEELQRLVENENDRENTPLRPLRPLRPLPQPQPSLLAQAAMTATASHSPRAAKSNQNRPLPPLPAYVRARSATSSLNAASHAYRAVEMTERDTTERVCERQENDAPFLPSKRTNRYQTSTNTHTPMHVQRSPRATKKTTNPFL